jgi:hypothetical protein
MGMERRRESQTLCVGAERARSGEVMKSVTNRLLDAELMYHDMSSRMARAKLCAMLDAGTTWRYAGLFEKVVRHQLWATTMGQMRIGWLMIWDVLLALYFGKRCCCVG